MYSEVQQEKSTIYLLFIKTTVENGSLMVESAHDKSVLLVSRN
jgi:hypothetical protein